MIFHDYRWLSLMITHIYHHYDLKSKVIQHTCIFHHSVCAWVYCFLLVSSSLLPHLSSNYVIVSVLVQQPQVLLHTYDKHYHTIANSVFSDLANVKPVVPTVLRLQTQDKCKHSTILLQLHNHIWFYFTWSTTHMTSALTHHIHNIKCLWFWCELLQYHYRNNCGEGGNCLI
jgi:hypothetical protein